MTNKWHEQREYTPNTESDSEMTTGSSMVIGAPAYGKSCPKVQLELAL